jgi:hypothetical protein
VGKTAAVQANYISLISGQRLVKNWMEKFALKLHSFLNEAPRGDRLPICPYEKGTRWAGILIASNNAQGCPSINQIPVIGKFLRDKN